MEENFATRLKLFIDSINVPTTKVADLCDIPRPSFSQLLSGRNQKVSDALIAKIHKAFPDLSVMWLMFGEGPMLNSEQQTAERSRDITPAERPLSGQDITESPVNGPNSSRYTNVSGLNQPQNPSNGDIIQQLEENKKIQELQLQIEKLQKNPRRVTKITVFYDDRSFDTFVPEK